MAVRSLYLPGHALTLAELSAARLDGDVVELGEGYAAFDAPDGPALRAASLRPILGTTFAATHDTAAWIHGVLDEPPSVLSLQCAVPRRIRRPPETRFRYRDAPLPATDAMIVGGVAVTTVARTLVDLALTAEPAHIRAGSLLASRERPRVDDALDRLAERIVPHKRRAVAILARWRDQPDVTR